MASHINQEGLLVVWSAEAASHIQQEGILVVASAFAASHILQEGLLVIRENIPDDAQPPRTSRASFVG